ncbi:MAG: SRPBCC family protein [Caulobacterales bacterium]|nr:SRPBCC family protein [Caulobacterales bacterium]
MTTTLIRPLAVTTPTDRDILVVRSFNAPRELVWKCFHTPAFVSRWLLGPEGWTMPVCEIDARVGGTFRYMWAHPDGRTMRMSGTFIEVSPPELTVHREQFDEDWGGEPTTVTTRFGETDGVTTVTMTISFVSREARDGARATGMTDGMEAGYARLDRLLAEMP